jgi:hypothetical protein
VNLFAASKSAAAAKQRSRAHGARSPARSISGYYWTESTRGDIEITNRTDSYYDSDAEAREKRG